MPTIKSLLIVSLTLGLAAFLTLAQPALAQTTTIVDANNSPYTVPSDTVQTGDTLIIRDGGSLSNASLTVLSGAALEFAPTTGTMTSPTTLSGPGDIIKSGAGTLRIEAQNTSLFGTTTLTGGSITGPGFPVSAWVFGTTGTVEFSGGFYSPASAANFSLSQKELIVTANGGGIDFTGNTGNQIITGYTGASQLGITGSGSLTIRGIGGTLNPANPSDIGAAFVKYTGYANPFSAYSGTTLLDGGLYAPDGTYSPLNNGGSPFGTSTVTLDGAVLSSFFFPNDSQIATLQQRTLTLANDLVLDAAGGSTHSFYINSQSFSVIELAGAVSGSGPLTNLYGLTTLSGANSFTGDTRLGGYAANVLTLANIDALAASTLDMNAADLGSLGLASTGTFYRLGGLEGSRNLTQATAGNWAIELGLRNEDNVFSGNLGQTGVSGYDGIVKSGTGTFTFTGDYFIPDTTSVIDPGMTVTGGVLAVGSDRSLGVTLSTNAVNTVAMTLDGGTLRQTTAFTVGRPIELGSGGGTLDTSIASNSDLPAFNGVISGTANLTIAANGDLTGTTTGGTVLGATNTYTGTTTITSGMVVVTSSFGNAANQLVLDGGGLLASGGTATNAHATQMAQSSGTLRAAGSSDVLNQAGVLSGTGNLLTAGSGTVNLQAANTHSGSTRAVAGTLNLANVDALQSSLLDMAAGDSGTVGFTVAGTNTYNLAGLAGSRNLANGGNTLSIGGSNQSTAYSGELSGNGALIKVGSGTLTLSGANTYSGGTTVSAGTLAGDATSLQGAIANDAAVEFNQATDGTYAGIMSGTGALTKIGAGTLTLSGANTYSGGTTVSAGTLKGSAAHLQGAITNNATVEFDQATAGTYAGAMSGTGNLVKNGAGALTLSGNNSYDGTTTVSAGTLLINGNQSAATGSLSVLSGATLGGSGTLGGSMSLASGSTLSPGTSPGTITSASGSWAGGANYNVQIVDAAGTSGTDWDLANFSGALDITATSGTPFLVNLWTLSSTGPDVNGNATNFSSNASYAWKIASAAGGVTGFAADKFTVNTSATNGTAGFANSFGSGQFSVANAGNDVNVVFTPAIVFDVTSGSQTQTQQGANASIDSAISVTKTGAGTVVMNGTNSYAAATSVNAGTMEVTGSITNSALTVNSGGTLAGTGTVAQLATVLGGGTLAPGAASPAGTGILSLGGLSLDSAATTVIAITGTTPGTDFDQVSILGSGSLGFGGTLDLSTSNIDSAVVGTSYRLFDFSGTPTGSFASLTSLGGIYSAITWSGPVGGVWTSTAGTGGDFLTFTEGTGTLAVVPEPSTLALAAIAGLGGLAMLRRRRRSTSAA